MVLGHDKCDKRFKNSFNLTRRAISGQKRKILTETVERGILFEDTGASFTQGTQYLKLASPRQFATWRSSGFHCDNKRYFRAPKKLATLAARTMYVADFCRAIYSVSTAVFYDEFCKDIDKKIMVQELFATLSFSLCQTRDKIK